MLCLSVIWKVIARGLVGEVGQSLEETQVMRAAIALEKSLALQMEKTWVRVEYSIVKAILCKILDCKIVRLNKI